MDEPYDDIDIDAELAFNDSYNDNNDDYEAQYQQYQAESTQPITQPLKPIDTNIHNSNAVDNIVNGKTPLKRKHPEPTIPDTPPTSIDTLYDDASIKDIEAITNKHSTAVQSPQHKKTKLSQVSTQSAKTYVHKHMPIKGTYAAAVVRNQVHNTNVTTHRTVYMTVQSETELNHELVERKKLYDCEKLNLGDKSINIAQMMSIVDQQLLQHKIEQSKLRNAEHQYDSDTNDTTEQLQYKRMKRTEQQTARDTEHKRQQRLIGDRLWVDKYTPATFQDLLSPEYINRQVLAWLCHWDTYVFGKKRIVKEKVLHATANNALNKLHDDSGKTYNSKRRQSINAQQNSNNTSTDSNDTRPYDKVILLCGAPGIGKTTIAHILARHAGYNPLEINASDDRTADVLMNKIKNATEMQNMMGSKKPNCIILDEIDGALGSDTADDKGAINALVKLITAKPRSKTTVTNSKDDNDDNGTNDSSDDENEHTTNKPAKPTKSTKTKSDHSILRRPIICICNDQYVPALRPLRAVAKVFVFEKPAKTRLLDRLKYICKSERIQCDDRILNALIELTDYDIRSCLNTLHFVRNSATKITLQQLNTLDIARKDMTKGQFSIWESILYKQTKHKNTKFTDYNQRSDMTAIQQQNNTDELNNLYNELLDYGEYQRITDGVYYNYLKLPFIDPTYDKTVQCSDWLSYYNMYDTCCMTEMDFALSVYIPLVNCAIHQILADTRNNKHRLEIPKQLYEYQQQYSNNHMLVSTYLSQNNNIFRLYGYTISCIVVDVLTSIVNICNPYIRNINISLLTPAEKAVLQQLVETMYSIGLTYKSVNTDSLYDQQQFTSYHLEPPIDTLLTYTDFTTTQHNTPPRHNNSKPMYQSPQRIDLSNRVRQLIAHQIELEAAKRAEQKYGSTNSTDSAATTDVNTSTTVTVSETVKPDIKTKQQMNDVQGQQGTSNFFAAYKARNAHLAAALIKSDDTLQRTESRGKTFLSNAQANKQTLERVKYNLHFKYNDGHTNAVRRPVYVKQFVS